MMRALLVVVVAARANMLSEMTSFLDSAVVPDGAPSSPGVSVVRKQPPAAAPPPPAAAAPRARTRAASTSEAKKTRVVFVKTYKTGSTTVSEFLAAVGYDLGLHALHPRDGGNFRAGELARRGAAGERYHLSYRHPTPRLDVASLGALVPDAYWCTIMREPVSRFVSTMLFVKRVGERYGNSPPKLVAAIQARKHDDGEANTFCNNVAWVLLGDARSLAYGISDEDAAAATARVRADLDGRRVDVLMQKDMAASLALVATRMGWDLEALHARVGSARATKKPRAAPKCADDACRRAVLSCNAVDDALYGHYEAAFDAEVARLRGDAAFARNRAALDGPPPSRPPPFAAKYPINCQQPNTGPPERKRWKLLNSCGGAK